MEFAHNHNNPAQVFCARSEDCCPFISENSDLRREVDILTEQVRTDALTGLYNFRFFSELLPVEMERTRRGTQPLAMILLDIDHFKKFNDQWGHELGNQALIQVAKLIKLAVRKLDYACRFGGEEFILVLPNTELISAIHVAERLRDMIESTPLVMNETKDIQITASLGIDLFTTKMTETSESFVQRVDAWLYQAKNAGRNRLAHPDFKELTSIGSVTLEEKSALFDVLNAEDQPKY